MAVTKKKATFCMFMFVLTFCCGCYRDRVIVEPNLTPFADARSVDIYRATNADKAILFLHGGGGNKHDFAHNLGIKDTRDESNYDMVNEHLLLANRMIAVFPQGRADVAGSYVPTWNNYAMDSGQDDMQFLYDLVNYISARYNVSRFYIVGHSMGGMMANRIWCEAPYLFEAYVAIAGPPSEHFLADAASCSSGATKPYLGIVGSDDEVLENGDWEAQTWTIDPRFASDPGFVNPVLIGERFFLSARVWQRCGETVGAGDADAITEGNITTWSFCGNSIALMRIKSGGHTVLSLEKNSGHTMLEFILGFINQGFDEP